MFHIDLKSGLPIYEQVYRTVVKLGAAGAFGENGQLPSVRAVAQELGVNPNTVQKAYALLERDGVIFSLPGKGSFLAKKEDVRQKHQEEALLHVRRSVVEALESGLSLSEIQQAAEEAAREKEGTAT